MNKQNKSVTKWATWIIAPNGYAYIGPSIDNGEEVWRDRHEKMINDPHWNGYKFIRVPISIPIIDEVVNKAIMEQEDD